MAIGGGGLSAQLMYAMNEMSKDLRSEHRERAEQEANLALQEGLAEANQMHEKADEQLKGAITSGIVSGIGAGVQVYAAATTSVASTKASEADKLVIQTANQRTTAIGNAGQSGGQLGKISGDVFEARASGHEANARQHAAQAQAATRRAEAARSAEQEAKQMGDQAREAHGQLIALEHAGTMAVLRG